jgi:hypothetical protein
MPTNILHDKLHEIAGKVRVLSLAISGLGSIIFEDDLAKLAHMADSIEGDLMALADKDDDGNKVVPISAA